MIFLKLKSHKIFDDKEENTELIKWMAGVTKPFYKDIVAIFLISLFSLCISYASTIIGKYVVDDATTGIINLRNMTYMGVGTAISIVISAASRLIGDYINENFSFGLRCKMYDNIQRSVWLKVKRLHTGDLLTRLTGDISILSGGLISMLPQIILVAFQFIIAFAILFHYDKAMAVIAVIIGPLGTVFSVLLRKKYKHYQLKLRESESDYRSFVQESLYNLTLTKSFQLEDKNTETLESFRRERLRLVFKSTRLSVIMNSASKLVYSIGYVVAFCWGAYRISNGFITYGTLTVFITLVSQVQGSIGGIIGIVPQIYSMLISGKRVYEIAELEKEEYNAQKPIPKNIDVHIKDLSFAYERDTVLRNVTFDVKMGSKVGIIGHSGSGKTTLNRLLLGLIKPDAGSIVYSFENGEKELAGADSRRFISYVPQGNTLISGTIADNLRLGNENADEQMMTDALKTVDAWKFVSQLPEGLNTMLFEKSGGLSEGQAQRIAIARALIAEKPILILDESTSALDEKTESVVLNNITDRYRSITCFIITHRTSMLKYCDRVIRIENGGTMAECANAAD